MAPDIEVAQESTTIPDAPESHQFTNSRSSEPTPDKDTPAEAAPAKEGDTVVTKGGLKVTVPKPRSRFQERISDLVNARDRHEGEARSLREKLAKYEGRDGQPIAKTAVPEGNGSRSDNGALNPEDFETYGQYVEALVGRTIENAAKAQQGKAGERAMENHRAERMDAFNEASQPLIDQHGDAFMEAISDPNLQVSEAMADAVMELDDLGPYVMLWLAANPKESLRISKLNPRAGTLAIGRLAATLDYEIKQGGDGATATNGGAAASAPTPLPPKPTPATVPTPRGGSPANLDGNPSDKMDMNSWLRAETDRLRRRNPNMKFYGAR